MTVGGEAEAWRDALIAQALLGSGRVTEALKRAEYAAATARERGLLWSLPRAVRVLAEARAEAGEPGVDELFDEAEKVARANGQIFELEAIESARESAPAAKA
jgi:hypothetical protein